MRSGSTWLGAAGVFALAVALRLPFTTDILFAWDSVLYARAIEHFAVGLEPLEARPHPPGYLFYVLAARATTWLLGDPNAGLILLSVVGGALACAAAYVIGTRLGERWVGLVAAALLLASPLLWQYSAVAYPYALLAVLMVGLGFWLWRSREFGLAGRVAASAGLGLAAGFRHDLFILLGPLWLVVAASGGMRALLASTAAIGLASLTWFVPTALVSGGIERYVVMSLEQAGLVGVAGGEESGLGRNLTITLSGLAAQLLLAWPLVFVGAWSVVRRGRRDLAALFALWILPGLLFYIGGHIGSWPYSLSLSMPLALLAGLGAQAIAMTGGIRTRVVVATAVAAIVVANAGWFLVGDGQFTAYELSARDRKFADRFAYVRAEFAPVEVAVLAEPSFLHVVHYLPEYRAVLVQSRRSAHPRVLDLPADARYAVLFDEELRIEDGPAVRRVAAGEAVLRVVDLRAGTGLVVRDGRLSLVTR